jgi:hypothetical protein
MTVGMPCWRRPAKAKACGPGRSRTKMSITGFWHSATKKAVAYKAARWAQILIAQRDDADKGFGHYSYRGAGSSLLHHSSLMTKGTALNDKLQKWAGNYDLKDDPTNPLEKIKNKTALYCSGFVVQCYVLATPRGTTPAINLDYRYVSPKRLQGEMNKGGDWEHVGYIKAGEI